MSSFVHTTHNTQDIKGLQGPFFVMDNYILLHFLNITADEQEILIAHLADINYEGFEQGKDFLKAFIPESIYEKSELESIPGFEKYHVDIQQVMQRNWNEEWEKSFEPVIIENFCAIRASFHPKVADVKHDIIITPKMSFGTGHHATTYLVIQLMEHLDFGNRNVLDFGTGTGVLAILAEKEGAAAVTAIDIDHWSIENARENLEANHCTRIVLKKADQIPFNESFDIILANINRHVILENLASMAKHLRPGGVLILSGLLKDDEKVVSDEALIQRLLVKTQSQKYDWIALELTNVKPA